MWHFGVALGVALWVGSASIYTLGYGRSIWCHLEPGFLSDAWVLRRIEKTKLSFEMPFDRFINGAILSWIDLGLVCVLLYTGRAEAELEYKYLDLIMGNGPLANQAAQSQAAPITPDMKERYIRGMCRYAPTLVYDYLSSHDQVRRCSS